MRRQPCRSTRLVTAAALGSALLVIGGCDTIRGWFGGGDNGSGANTPVQPDANAQPAYQASTQALKPTVTPLPSNLQPVNRPVNQGRIPSEIPLVYLVETDGGIRVANVDTGEEIITFNTTRGHIVSVTAKGVALDGHPLIGVTLSPGNYGIYLVQAADAGTLHATNGTVSGPTPRAPRPATQPVTPPPGSDTLSMPPPGTRPTQ